MTFTRAVDVYQTLLDRGQPGLDARQQLLEFLGWEEPYEAEFARDVRIILVAADFSKEITTAVLWLNERDLDIRCVRMKPYKNGAELIMDVQQVVPLPEAEDYVIHLKEKEQAQRASLVSRQDRRAFWTAVLPELRRVTGKFLHWSPSNSDWLASKTSVAGVRVAVSVRRNDCTVELYIDGGPGSRDWNKAVYDQLVRYRAEIDAACGPGLEWLRKDKAQASCLAVCPAKVGYASSPEEWPEAARLMAEQTQRMFTGTKPFLELAVQTLGEQA
jgi:hypothetical protein